MGSESFNYDNKTGKSPEQNSEKPKRGIGEVFKPQEIAKVMMFVTAVTAAILLYNKQEKKELENIKKEYAENLRSDSLEALDESVEVIDPVLLQELENKLSLYGNSWSFKGTRTFGFTKTTKVDVYFSVNKLDDSTMEIIGFETYHKETGESQTKLFLKLSRNDGHILEYSKYGHDGDISSVMGTTSFDYKRGEATGFVGKVLKALDVQEK